MVQVHEPAQVLLALDGLKIHVHGTPGGFGGNHLTAAGHPGGHQGIILQLAFYLAQLSGGDFVHKPHLHGVPVDFAVLPLGDGEYGIPQAEGGDDQGRTAADADYRHPEPFLVAEQITQSDLQMKGQPFPDKADAFQQYPLADGGCFGAHELGGYGSQRGEAGPQGGQGNGRNRRQGSGN